MGIPAKNKPNYTDHPTATGSATAAAIVDATATVTIKSKERLADTASESSTSSMITSGDNPVRQSGRYFKIKVVTPSGSVWTHAQGVDLIASRMGLR